MLQKIFTSALCVVNVFFSFGGVRSIRTRKKPADFFFLHDFDWKNESLHQYINIKVGRKKFISIIITHALFHIFDIHRMKKQRRWKKLKHERKNERKQFDALYGFWKFVIRRKRCNLEISNGHKACSGQSFFSIVETAISCFLNRTQDVFSWMES